MNCVVLELVVDPRRGSTAYMGSDSSELAGPSPRSGSPAVQTGDRCLPSTHALERYVDHVATQFLCTLLLGLLVLAFFETWRARRR